MKQRIALPLLLLLLVSIGLDIATSAQGGASANEETVRLLDDQERKAVLDRNYAALEHLWCDQLTVNSPANNVVIGKRDVLARVQKSANYSSFERRIEFIRIDGNMAIVMGAETVQPIGDAPLAGKTVQRRFTNIWKKDGETWCVIARHANVVSSR
jgi:ketosteroid isomerase-like protein